MSPAPTLFDATSLLPTELGARSAAAKLFPATFALARHAGWTAHVIEQASANKLIRPDMRYTGPAERDLPA